MADGEAQLAKRAAKGDSAAQEVLYRRYVDRVWRYGYLRTRSREGAAEIVQETFLRVMKFVKGFEGRSSFGTWLYSVARTAAVDYARRESRERTLREGVVLRFSAAGEAVSPPPRDGVGHPEGKPKSGETTERVRAAIGELSGPHRDVLVLCEISDMSIREAAEVLGWGESRVKVTLHRARLKLREMLEEREEGVGIRV